MKKVKPELRLQHAKKGAYFLLDLAVETSLELRPWGREQSCETGSSQTFREAGRLWAVPQTDQGLRDLSNVKAGLEVWGWGPWGGFL